MPTSTFSLLWPSGTQPTKLTTPLDAQCIRDLGLDSVTSVLSQGPFGRSKGRDILLNLTTDPAVIHYRQKILETLWQQPAFTNRLEELLPEISTLDAYRSSVDRERSTLQEVTWRLGELEQYVTCITGLTQAFSVVEGELSAAGLQTLQQAVVTAAADQTYQNMARELPAMLRTLRSKASITVGINLDNRLRPNAATLLSVNEQKFTTSSFLDRLFGRKTEELDGIGPLHTVPEISALTPAGSEWQKRETNPLMVPLFRDLAKVLDKVYQPIAHTLRQYVSIQTSFLTALSGEIAFYLAAVRLRQRLEARGMPVTLPEIAPMSERVCHLKDSYNLNLALHLFPHDDLSQRVIKNEVQMDDNGRVFILTGPNQGGKTTYTQMIGLAQVLAQAGLWVPATAARLSPIDQLFTHYPIEEKLEKGTGRFGDEARRLSEIFSRATPHSLILLNESLASTSPGESLYIAQDIVRIMSRMGLRAIFNTHLHALAETVDELNEQTESGSTIVSLVASRIHADKDSLERSYKILPSRPLGRSYAREIAAKYGISYKQLEEKLTMRGVLDSEIEKGDRRDRGE